ncbi:uncharacterized protein LOC129774019 [Toxorhynchites rutilus septentrionalis]|uniref:uncharacterized protein LOC129774019 n=1 Tax=Toxorhynchites rutilus septentrionalis TaxID=329112 RepID=UPI0024799DFD|nr:uncharacterized protein LOC129774019 [Toxorhynchites rutilus septentrionalis]
MKEDVVRRLGKSRDIALRRLLSTERRLARDVNLREQYVLFMEEYMQLGHMQKITEADQDLTERCYLPHHPVVKETSTTTKIRVVFDASCKTSSGVALNDGLLVGPVIQDDLRSIVLRCRIKQIMLVADVEKMFRQILVRYEDRHYQSILWRPSPNQEVDTFELNTVTYGTKPAPFLATRTLKLLAMDERESLPLAAKAVEEDIYMDDVITGANTKEEALELQIQLNEMLKRGGFRLRKWASNCPEALHGISGESLAIRDYFGINISPDSMVKTLGLNWSPQRDEFMVSFNISPLDKTKPITKRQVLSIIATLFDPLGLIGAVITTAKVFMQQIWTLRCNNNHSFDWDQPLPSMVGESWRKFYEQLHSMNNIRIDRCVIIPGAVSVQLHCFSDASEKAYGGCIYVRSENSEGKIIVRLLTSKSKVSPLKTQSIPRLELCGALLTAQLFEKAMRATHLNVPTYFWTDSTCVLRWIQSVPTTWTTYVANRVAKIQNITEGFEWRHVSGIQNPADMISRGIFPNDIQQNEIWWYGPHWLAETSIKWPSIGFTQHDEAEDERRHLVIAAPTTTSPTAEFNEWYLEKFSSYSNLLRRTVVWLRLMEYLIKSPDKRTGFITTDELHRAERILVRCVQKECFVEEWKALLKNDSVPRNSPLRWFNPYVSKDQVLRVGERLRNAAGCDDTKHPMVLPARHRFTRMLLKHYHVRLFHAGPQLLLNTVRLRFWPLGGRSTAKQIVHQCIKCFRSEPSLIQQFMGDLPAARVTISRPFSKTGIDYFGPVYIRPGPRRTAVKAYVSLFVCMCTKAVHLELVSDLSTDRFIQALRRFMARRGKCTDIYSDNGTNFVGARNKLREFMRLLRDKQHSDKISRMCADEGVQWHFNPPSAPHFGGLWEAAVRSAKHHLLRVIGENPVSIEDMTTLLAQVEACLNSRPITPISNDPCDLQPLTPAHFLIGSSLQDLPEPDLLAIPSNRLHHWQLIQQRLQHFWKRWQGEYLCQLQGRSKRWKPPIPIQTGKLVIIKEDNLPPLRWKMGRIEEIHPGSDGIVRVVTLKTATGSLRRPIEKICFLPELNEENY